MIIVVFPGEDTQLFSGRVKLNAGRELREVTLTLKQVTYVPVVDYLYLDLPNVPNVLNVIQVLTHTKYGEIKIRLLHERNTVKALQVSYGPKDAGCNSNNARCVLIVTDSMRRVLEAAEHLKQKGALPQVTKLMQTILAFDRITPDWLVKPG